MKLHKNMAQNIYIITNTQTKLFTNHICQKIQINGIFESPDLTLTEELLLRMAKMCKVEYFYVIVPSREIIFNDSAFKFKPPIWDSAYLHMWNNDSVIRLFNTSEVLKNASYYTDENLKSGNVKLKELDKNMFSYCPFDMFLLSYGELSADINFENLKLRYPHIKRIEGVKGISQAHKKAAALSSTYMFYVIDADAEVLHEFKFNHHLSNIDINTVYVWNSRNPVNGLEYGYGGVKLLPKQLVLSASNASIDFTTSISSNFKIMADVANITKFDTSSFSTWRSAFRECVKLSSRIINGQVDGETQQRLHVWCTIGNGKFGKDSILGAQEGATFGKNYANEPNMLKLINDFNWLEEKFNSQQR